ncbi:MAG TPA: ABC transporter ATP-binding protein [Mobilitalea sp.]|nr:ABC transporter ATP-binding protein [Mobilitalea sp.]
MRFEVIDGSFQFKRDCTLLNNINFCMEKSEVLSILGANGVGKTTLIRCMLGMLPWTKGGTYLDGVKLTTMKSKDIWQRIGYVPQARLSVFSYLVEDMILLGRNPYIATFGQPGKLDYEVVEECLELVGITHLKGKYCNQISGGELQLVLIARALASKPSLLVLDEPESGLDFRNQMIVLDMIQKLCKESSIAAIINTHYPEHAISVSDKTLLLLQDGTNLFGDTGEILQEEYMEQAFGVKVYMKEITLPGKKYTCVVPVNII